MVTHKKLDFLAQICDKNYEQCILNSNLQPHRIHKTKKILNKEPGHEEIHSFPYSLVSLEYLLNEHKDFVPIFNSFHLEGNLDLAIEQGINIDHHLGYYQNAADYMIHNSIARNTIAKNSKDPLFSLFRNYLNEKIIFDHSKIHISLSNSGELNPDPTWIMARKIMSKFPNVEFHLVIPEMIEFWGDKLLKHFDGFMNPGGRDSFPRDKLEFNLKDCSNSLPIEKIYSYIVKKSFELNVPYFGICSGAQHLALFHDSFLGPVNDYKINVHNVRYQEGTLSHFMALDEQQKIDALNNCKLPIIEFNVDTYNNYAVIALRMGEEINLDSVADDGVAMAYTHKNAIRYGVQYHPEHRYGDFDIDSIHQTIIIDSFIETVILEHNFKYNNATHPSVYYLQVKERLEECLAFPTCLMGEE